MIDVTDPQMSSAPGGLNDSLSGLDSSAQPFNVLTGYNLGNRTVLLSIPMHRFYEMSAVANERGLSDRGEPIQVAQRKLDANHATKLAVYILKGLVNAAINRRTSRRQEIPEALRHIRLTLGPQPYMALQPIVANIRSCGPDGAGIRVNEIVPGAITVWLGDGDVLWVVDGQHRRYALDLVFEFLKEVKLHHAYPKRPNLYPSEKGHTMLPDELEAWLEVYEVARATCRVTVEVHLGLDVSQERQLFYDLNNLGKKVEASLAFVFDNSNPVNIFIKEDLVESNLLNATVVERDVIDWHKDPGAITWKDLTSVCAILFLNKTNIKGAKPADVNDRAQVAREFWEAINRIEHFGQPQAKKKTVAAQPVVLKALAKLTYDFAFGRAKDPAILEKLLNGIPHVDFSHQNAMWRYYELSEDERESMGLSGLSAYLPPNNVGDSPSAGANRDVGRFDPIEQVMRFGAKHNDIYPLIGDMVRWKLGLPSRHRAGPDVDIDD